MSSEANKMFDDHTAFKDSELKLCANGCGFFGSAATKNLCSNCFKDLCISEKQVASAKAAIHKPVNPNPKPDVVDSEPRLVSTQSPSSSRCSSCRKKVGVVGFRCRCGATFCGTHRYPEKHDCKFDFKAMGRDIIAKANPLVKADKLLDRV